MAKGRTAKKTVTGEAADAPEAHGASSRLQQPQPAKKRKQTERTNNATSNAGKKRTSGKFAALVTSMPMEILFDIMSHLTPKDLLSFARSTKPFRNILLRRSAIGAPYYRGEGHFIFDFEQLKEKILNTSKEEWLTFSDERKQHLAQIREHAARCEAWSIPASDKRAQARGDLKLSRYNAVKERLSELGWGEELKHCAYRLSQHALIKQPRALTERVWNNIREPLLLWIANAKSTRIIRSREEALMQLYYPLLMKQNVPSMEGWPTAAMNLETDDTEKEIFDKAMSGLAEAIQSWRHSNRDRLLALLPANTESGHGAVSPENRLSLATSVFHVNVTGEKLLHYPAILLHRYFTGKLVRRSFVAEPLEPWHSVHGYHTDYSGDITHDELGAAVVKCLLGECGLDSGTATPADLDNLDARFCCLVSLTRGNGICSLGGIANPACNFKAGQDYRWGLVEL
ncbi:hypothetical protein BOTBODRAFT_48283 [Botryobasidium botryosum FD-172 SS1]|uniref:F-box domain-containing protein n=1 Tax=Botryobasidium botryosum (strain FD-172 SS1) TaxID=930990 RepID=A0A067LY99_BOTB1|nr:hypothetical protein BOTBODRAFT_48283 [Botryobasidium botryosum FD-172 SS1]